jgi:hypothetical protein
MFLNRFSLKREAKAIGEQMQESCWDKSHAAYHGIARKSAKRTKSSRIAGLPASLFRRASPKTTRMKITADFLPDQRSI